MALNNIERTIILDVYDHDTTPTKIKAIALDSKTRYVLASLRNNGNVYDAGQNTTVTLTIIRPDNVGVQITGETRQIVDLTPEGEITVYGVYAELTQTALAVKGNLRAQFMLTSGDQILRTEIFAINCGEALDASTDTWAGEYQGYNLDELVQSFNESSAKVDAMEDDVSDLKEGLSGMTTATSADVGKALTAKTVTNGKVTEWEYKDSLNDRFATGELVVSENLFDISQIDLSCYYWTDGRHSSGSYNSTNLMPVTEGQTIYFQTGTSDQAINRANRTMRFVIAYDSSEAVVSSACQQSVQSYTVPSGVAYIRISAGIDLLAEAYKPVVLAGDGTKRDYIPYFEPYYTSSVLKEEYNNTDYINELIDAKIDDGVEVVRHLTNGFVYEFDMNSDDHIFNADTDLVQDMFNYSIQFMANVTTFNGIIIGHGYNTYMGGNVRVTPTDFEFYISSESNPRLSEAHNLTIKDYIAVRIDAKPNFQADFTIYTNGGVYTKKNQSWDVRRGYLSVRHIGTNVLTDCALSYMCKGWSEPIHLYGNSYFGVYSDKWTQYLVTAGWTKYNLNGYPGRASAEALKVCRNVLSHSNPEKIVWCLGMNDGDDAGETNASWIACVTELKTICESRNIELILATIPNVATVDNSAKNAHVEASGLRYIDFATAVGAHDGTTWYDGMLSSDGVHPSAQGAIALFNEAIATVPELMQ